MHVLKSLKGLLSKYFSAERTGNRPDKSAANIMTYSPENSKSLKIEF